MAYDLLEYIVAYTIVSPLLDLTCWPNLEASVSKYWLLESNIR